MVHPHGCLIRRLLSPLSLTDVFLTLPLVLSHLLMWGSTFILHAVRTETLVTLNDMFKRLCECVGHLIEMKYCKVKILDL